MSDELRKLPGDAVPDLDPVTFGVAFTRAMRRQRTAVHTPSLRTSVAIPRWLTARCLRTGGLTPADYVEAAVRCTPLEDQDLAEAVARGIVFPQAASEKPSTPQEPKAATAPAPPTDAVADILGDLASLDLDLDAIDDLSDLDALLAADQDEGDTELGAFDLFERLYSSADPEERALGELIHRFGGPAELEASAVRTVFLARVWVAKHLLAAVGALTPELCAFGVTAGYGRELRRACTEPWEVAGVLAGQTDPALEPLLDDLLQHGASRELGRTLAFLAPHPDVAARRSTFADAALARALDLTDFAELVVGLGSWLDPDPDLLEASIAVSPRRALEAGAWLEQTFGIDLRPDLFDRWLRTRPRPDLGELALLAVATESWERALDGALEREVARFDGSHARLEEAVGLTAALVATGLAHGRHVARRLATEAMVRVADAPLFLPLLDAFLERGVVPEVDPVLARARELGVSEEEVLDRLGQALEQLRQMVLSDAHDADRYQRLVQRVRSVPASMMEELCACACASGNLEAMAALLAVDMGGAAAHLDDDQVASALGHKGIGGGNNLLVQWFTHRRGLRSTVAARIKEQVKATLLDEALDWVGQGDGSGERGLIPQQRSRPFRAGDGLDQLDLESTLEAIVTSGRSLDQVTEEDLYASETARGRAALVVLIDISGSMSGGELAVCAIAVVMLLGRLLPEEVALAVFESDTHPIKGFRQTTDLDAVADQVLELQATGGTRADAALSWAAEELAGAGEADVRVLFLLSDYAFFEGEDVLRARCTELAEHGARLLAASHGYVSRQTLSAMLETMGGEHLEMDDLRRLPGLLLAALCRLGD